MNLLSVYVVIKSGRFQERVCYRVRVIFMHICTRVYDVSEKTKEIKYILCTYMQKYKNEKYLFVCANAPRPPGSTGKTYCKDVFIYLLIYIYDT